MGCQEMGIRYEMSKVVHKSVSLDRCSQRSRYRLLLPMLYCHFLGIQLNKLWMPFSALTIEYNSWKQLWSDGQLRSGLSLYSCHYNSLEGHWFHFGRPVLYCQSALPVLRQSAKSCAKAHKRIPFCTDSRSSDRSVGITRKSGSQALVFWRQSDPSLHKSIQLYASIHQWVRTTAQTLPSLSQMWALPLIGR